MMKKYFRALAVILSLLPLWPMNFAAAHHILGRPAYSLNEDSNTPPSIQGEALLGEFSVTFMVYPAFPKPGEPGRVSLYVKRQKGGAPYQGKVSFTASRATWLPFGPEPSKLGVQPPDDNVFRQGFKFPQAGDYIVTASFDSDGHSHVIDIPLRVGAPSAIGPIGIVVAILLFVLVTLALVQRRRAMTGKVRSAMTDKVRSTRQQSMEE